MSIPKLQDILQAQKRIRPYLVRTPLHSYPAINELVGTTLFIKHENYQPVGAFKVRGGINLVSQLSQEERERGVIAASTGNHGQSVAYAATALWCQSNHCRSRKRQSWQGCLNAGNGSRGCLSWRKLRSIQAIL